MNVIKRDGAVVPYDRSKIFNAISKAFKSCKLAISADVINEIVDEVQIWEDIDVEDIQDQVEELLMDYDFKVVAKHYILYREQRKAIRESRKKYDEMLKEKYEGQNIKNQNANLDEASFGGKMGEASSFVAKQYALDYCMSKMAKENHLNNEIYIHDLNSYAVGMHNCLTVPIDELLAKGFKTRQTNVRGAGSVSSAFQLLAVIFQLQSLQQFGGVSASHLDWSMVPYVRLSFYKKYNSIANILSFIGAKPINLNTRDEIKALSITDEKYQGKHWWNFYKRYKYHKALQAVKKELAQAVEGMYHNLNTLQSRSGNQLPFTSINYGTCTKEEGRLVTEALLIGSIKGVGDQLSPNEDPEFGRTYGTPIFPCSIFQYMKGVNDKEGTPNYDLFLLALKSTARRLYPNYVNVDWSVNKGYDRNDPKTYVSTMGCHALNTPIIMADGTRKMVQDVNVGDKVMGADGTPRNVLSLIRGNDKMFKVEQSRGESYIVNEGHILALEYSASRKYKHFKKGDRVNMSLHDYLELPDYIRRFFKGYKGSYDLEEKEFKIPPYILGLWLGNGLSSGTRFSVNKKETQILEDLQKYASSINKKLTIREEKGEECFSVDVADAETRNEGNYFRKSLFEYNLINNKHIPECYFYGSKEQRSALLAGLINTDGWARNRRGRRTICFGNTNYNLILGAKRIADSLGYTTHIIKARGETIGQGICEGSILKPYYHLSIHNFHDEHLMPNKRIMNDTEAIRNFDTSVLKISEVGKGDFYGFELDGDKLYLFNDCTVTHNCRTYNGFDINANPGTNPQTKDGRGNLAPVTIILPTLAIEAKKDVDLFMKRLDDKIHEAKDMLIERYQWMCKQDPSSAKFMYENGTMLGYVPEEGIESALKHGTLAIGQIALAETLQILIGKDHTTKEGMELAIKIEKLFNIRCAEFKKQYHLNFGVYYTPAENLCYTAMTKFKAKYGDIENVTYYMKDGKRHDKPYFTNSIHVPVYIEMSPFEKIEIESKLTGYSNAGCITYIELNSSVINNIKALKTCVQFAMDKDIPYFAINVPADRCQECGYQGEIGEVCPHCGSTHIKHLRRVTGYLTGDYRTAFNPGKQAEVLDRVKHTMKI